MEHPLARVCHVCILWGSQYCPDGIYLLLVLFIAYPVAYTLSYGSGVFISYYLNARFVFREKLRLSKAMQYPNRNWRTKFA
jgi:putative flippase GtrA